MSARPAKLAPPSLALQQKQAAMALGVSDEVFVREIRPQLKTVYVGSLRLFAVAELRRWLDDNGLTPHDGSRHGKRPRAVGPAASKAHEKAS